MFVDVCANSLNVFLSLFAFVSLYMLHSCCLSLLMGWMARWWAQVMPFLFKRMDDEFVNSNSYGSHDCGQRCIDCVIDG